MIDKRILIMLCIVICSFISCDKEALGPAEIDYPEGGNENRVSIDQGIWGEVLFWEGNFMPIVYPDVLSGQISPVVRTVFIHEATKDDQVQWVYVEIEPCCGARFISEISTDLVAFTQSDDLGFFEIELPAGRYSIFVREYDYLYANLFAGEGYIFPVEVREGEVTGIKFDITYKAYF
jgi:hypothetical protein